MKTAIIGRVGYLSSLDSSLGKSGPAKESVIQDAEY
jgi:hypothetical protein